MNQETTEGFYLSPIQERLWSRRESLGERAAFVLRIEGAVNPTRLREALDQLSAAYEILRTGYPAPDDMPAPLQTISAQGLAWLEPMVARGETANAVADRLLQETTDAAAYARLAILTDDEALLLASLPSLSADFDTPALFAAALARAYHDPGGFAGEEPMQYADIAEWLNENLDMERHDRSDWSREDARAGEPVTVPFETGEAQAFEPASCVLTIGESWPSQSRAADIAPRAAAAAAWALALSRASVVTAPRIGVYSDGRALDQLHGALGPLGQFLPVSQAISPRDSFRKLAEGLAAKMAELADRHGHFFPQLLEEDGDFVEPRFGFACIEGEDSHEAGEPRITPFDQRIHLAPMTACLRIDRRRAVLEYNAAVLPRRWAQAIADRAAALLTRGLAHPDAPISELNALTGEEWESLVIRPNRTDAMDPSVEGKTLPQLFEAQVARTPHQPAATHQGEQLTFDELNRRANQLAHALRGRGVGLETRVAICLPRSLDMMVAVWGALKAGATYLPLEPDDPPERMRYILEHGRASLVLCRRPNAPEFPDGTAAIDLASFNGSAYPDVNPETRIDPSNGAYMIYTSGSTGRPKGVLIEHRSPVNLRVAMHRLVYADLREGPRRISMNAPLSFDASMQQICMMTVGHCLCIVPQETRFDGAAFVKWIHETGLEVLDITPAHLTALVDAGLLDPEPASLQRIQIAGGAIHQDLWDKLAHAKGRYFDIYGPTECTVNATGEPIERAGVAPCIGPPLANYRIYLTDSCLKPSPRGTTGQIAIGGAGLARGYADRPELTAAQFTPDAFSGHYGARLYLSGDAARFLEDDRLEFVGRIDRQLKIRGYRVELGEIERALTRHEGVSSAAVLAHTPEHAGQDDIQLVAYYEPASEEVDTAELQRFLQRSLPYYMIPALFAPVKPMPLTPNGKVDHKALPDPAEIRKRSQRTPPRDAIEEKLARIWSEQLGVDDIGVFDDFYSLGGHSLQLLLTIRKINEAFAGKIRLREFFDEPTIAAVADKLRAAEEAALRSEEAAALLEELDGLSPEEIKAMLAEEKSAQ